ncbi:hypothetical protein [Bacillus sp. Bva_UNVM-123]
MDTKLFNHLYVWRVFGGGFLDVTDSLIQMVKMECGDRPNVR